MPEAEPFLQELPERAAKRLSSENPREKWEYGKDWVNLGYRPGGVIMIQKMAAAQDFRRRSALMRAARRSRKFPACAT